MDAGEESVIAVADLETLGNLDDQRDVDEAGQEGDTGKSVWLRRVVGGAHET